eukprot:7760635-Pyramimonas_sp.AAC.1
MTGLDAVVAGARAVNGRSAVLGDPRQDLSLRSTQRPRVLLGAPIHAHELILIGMMPGTVLGTPLDGLCNCCC